MSPDEGRYATIALEMMRSGDWVTPRLNGILYFEKPALQYWIGALAFHVFGISEFAARFWPGLAGWLTVVAVGSTAWRLWGRDAGVQAFALAGSTTWIIANSHFLTLDAGLTLFLTLALCSFLLAEVNTDDPLVQKRWFWLAWAAIAGAVLSKGLVGLVIPGAVIVLLALWQRDPKLLLRVRPISGALIFLAIAAPWFVMVSMRNPGYAEFFFIHEHFARYLSNVHRREGAWWYYIPVLLAGLLPWTFSLGAVLLTRAANLRTPADLTVRRTLLVWCGFIIVFFSISGSKLPSYVLPVFPALALLFAQQLRQVKAKALRWHAVVPMVLWALALAASFKLHSGGLEDVSQEVGGKFADALFVGAALFFGFTALSWWSLAKKWVSAAILLMAMGHFLGSTVVMQSHDHYGQLKSADKIADALVGFPPDMPVYAVRNYDQTLPFYLRRSVILVEYVDEFEFGQKREPSKSIATLDEFVSRWSQSGPAAAYLTHGTLPVLRDLGVAMRIAFDDGRQVVIVKP